MILKNGPIFGLRGRIKPESFLQWTLDFNAYSFSDWGEVLGSL